MKKSIKIMIIIFAIVVCVLGLRGKLSGEKFDSQKWKTTSMNSENDFSLRWDMMNSLRNDYDLIGMNESEIISLLGKPDENFSSEKNFRYYLGYSKSGINTGSLILIFENEVVKKIYVTQG